MKKTEQ